jgi:hypothetical protein|tara:strand:- start:296 stop:565 length:270 start_codon:yes stop_codon:yes gene_type:complete
MQLLHEHCEKNKADDKKLPSDSFLVTYKVEEEVKYDITRAGSVNEIFDHYYDKYKNVQGIAWTKGIVSPRSFDNTTIEEKPKKKRKRRE